MIIPLVFCQSYGEITLTDKSRLRKTCVISRRLRGLLRRDDLVRGAAGEFGHVVELGREGADPRRRRADLDDQIADPGLRHHRLHRIPTRPAVARVETEALPAPPG